MKLSVNLNKVSLLRNSRGANNPGPLWSALTCIQAGAAGITLHLREDRRHATDQDVRDVAALCREKGVEFNLEGDTRDELVATALEVKPTQLTLVPVTPGEITSDHGWDLPRQRETVVNAIARAKDAGIRTSIFLDADAHRVSQAAETGTDRIEIYTEPYGAAFGTSQQEAELQRIVQTAQAARSLGLGVNAGHDLTCDNLPLLARAVPQIDEVSIGHALIADALFLGLQTVVGRYLAATRGQDVPPLRTE